MGFMYKYWEWINVIYDLGEGALKTPHPPELLPIARPLHFLILNHLDPINQSRIIGE